MSQKIRSRFSFLLLISIISFCFSAAVIHADDKESLRIVFADHYPPYSFKTEGVSEGILIDFWKLWSVKTGIPLSFIVADTWEDSLDALRKHQADIHAGLFYSPERSTWIDFSRALYTVDNSLFFPADSSVQDITETSDISILVAKESYHETYLRDNYPFVNIITVDNPETGIRMLIEGKADAALSETLPIFYTIKKMGVDEAVTFSREPLFVKYIQAGVKKEDRKLIPLINSGISQISREEISEIEKKWITEDYEFFLKSVLFIDLTEEELQYINNHPLIIYGSITTPPFYFLNPDGLSTGILPEYSVLLRERAGINLAKSDKKNWNEVLDEFYAGYSDCIFAVPTPERKKTMLFSDPFVYMQGVMVLNNNSKYIISLSDIHEEKTGFIKGAYLTELVIKDHPGIIPILVDDEREGLKMVKSGDLDVFIGNKSSVFMNIQLNGYSDLTVKEIEYRNPLCMAALPENVELISITDKLLDTIPESERYDIYSRWVYRHYTDSTWNRDLLKLIIPAAIVTLFIIIMYMIWSLTRIMERRRYIMILENASESILIISHEGTIQTCISGQLKIHNIYEKINGDDSRIFRDAINLCLGEKEKVVKFDMQLTDLKSGTELKDYFITMQNFIHRREIRGIVADFRDITDRKNLERALREAMLASEKVARTDFLTHIPNRRYFLEVAERDLNKIKRSRRGSVAVLMIDIDFFKTINDLYGHDQGDQVLKEIAWIFTRETRSADFLARYGGEEFIALLHDTAQDKIFQTADRFRKVLEDYTWPFGRSITASIGVSVYRKEHSIITDMINEADKALYKAKETGRNRVVIFSKEM